jgi:cytochrome c peroxidase
MKSGRFLPRVTAILILALLSVLALTFTRAKAQSGTPNVSVVPLRPLAPLSTVPVPPIPGIKNYISSQSAAIALGKALFWDMQVGSDGVQACATCHFNAGADSRTVNQISPGIKAGDTTFQVGSNVYGIPGPNYALHAGTQGSGFGGYHDGDFPLHKVSNPDDRGSTITDVNDVVSSQGVFSSNLDHIVKGSGVDAVTITTDFFSFPDPADSTKMINTRRVEPRNTPSVVNAVYNFRNFWDGRAQNVCNGANPFGDRDTTSHFFSASKSSSPLTATFVRLQNSSLCSQALGPALSSFEMSAANRNFKQLGKKMLALTPLQSGIVSTPLGKQLVDPNDSVLGFLTKTGKKGLNTTYVQMIKNAFAAQWWQSSKHVCVNPDQTEVVIDPTKGQKCPAGADDYAQMEYNFSLFWGLAVQAYESTLISNQTPFDQYLATQKNSLIPGDNVTNFFTLNLATKIEPYTINLFAADPSQDASDQNVFAFDDGNGNLFGTGIIYGFVDYTVGTVWVQFERPPTTTIPVNLYYHATGTTAPLTPGQIRGLNLFQSKAKCIACHSGPELSNAVVGNVVPQPLERMTMGDFNIRVYDNGFYYIGVRPATDDISVADVDGAAGLPLSESELMRRQVCNDPSLVIMVPSRLGEGITAQPLSCGDGIANLGNMKTPMLRNVALTAPYFHNGGQLTLEQVVEFYNRGGDFQQPNNLDPNVDPNIEALFLTAQEKTDLVDFLRNGLTDARTVKQAAPFDHPQIFLPNGHPADPFTGYPVINDPNHPGQATDLPYPMLMVPAVGKKGGTPLPTFLQNLQSP